MKKYVLLLSMLLCLLMMESFKIHQNTTAELVLDAKARLGEGAIWHPTEKKLYWLDIEAAALHIYDPATKEDIQFSTGEKAGTIVPIQGGGVLLAMQNSIRKMDTSTGDVTLVTQPLNDSMVRFNDGKADPAGRFWVGTMAHDIKEGAAALYRMDKDKGFHQVLDKVTISNGIVWSADKKTMYYVDTPTLTVQAFDYDDKTGDLSNGRVVVRVPESLNGSPDGMTIDAEGKLWVALWGAAAVIRCDPATGEILQRIEVPALQATSVAFGGENLDILYITTVREWLTPEQLEKYPLSGGLFAVKPGVRGVPAELYRGEL
ncbi:SMP-30/gluconolactonase/LRE family protein [Pontibacter silvestris]|uniref:SMP-30/gluconolactonase/LRE family protein n=1 Tax=Pontibacter silvestris TaxID=2305183 RepID=A0ABW4X3N7_9BACT|nr:SMP-30/gluconolactonase/LRE family protein [Pontibacter silvestris]MCC9137060.1 SMP-30/gluconolactonase/LRE family protein [Pontibacter silvestris]